MKNLENNVTKLYWIQVFTSTQMQSIVGVIFLLSKGFTLSQILLFGSVYAVGSLLSEIPTGSFSDRIGRKNSLLLATILEIPAVIIVILSNSFWVIAAMHLVFGIAASFNSGTDTATLYDTLKALNKETLFTKINGKLKWLGAWGGAIGGIVGGIIAKYDLSFAWWAWVVILICILLTKLTLVEPPKHEYEIQKESFYQHVRKSILQSFTGEVGYFIVYFVVVWLFFWLGYSLWQPYLALVHLPVEYFGFLYAGVSLVSGWISKNAHVIENKIGMRFSLSLIPLILAEAFYLESLTIFIYGSFFIAIQAVASGYFSPILDDYVNSRIPSQIRATVLSVQNMFSRLTFTIVSPMVGYFIDLYSLPTALALMASILVCVGVIYFIHSHNLRFENHHISQG